MPHIPWIWIVALLVVGFILYYKYYLPANKPPASSVANIVAPIPPPSTKLLTFEKGSIISFEYKGGPLICEPLGGEVLFVDPLGNEWKDKPGKIVNRVEKLHRGWHFVSRTRGSSATGVKVTQLNW
jgi:hypothetical protein